MPSPANYSDESYGKKVFFAKMPTNVRDSEFAEFLKDHGYGNYTKFNVKRNYAFVEFDTETMAKDCIRDLNHKTLLGERIVTDMAKAMPGRGRFGHGNEEDGNFRRRGRFENDRYNKRGSYHRDDGSDSYSDRRRPRKYEHDAYERRPGKYDRPEKYERNERNDRNERTEKYERTERNDRFRKNHRPYNTDYRLYVHNLDSECSWRDLKDHFRQYGHDVCFVEANQRNPGQGVVEFSNAKDMDEARSRFNNTDFRGKSITVEKHRKNGRSHEDHKY